MEAVERGYKGVEASSAGLERQSVVVNGYNPKGYASGRIKRSFCLLPLRDIATQRYGVNPGALVLGKDRSPSGLRCRSCVSASGRATDLTSGMKDARRLH